MTAVLNDVVALPIHSAAVSRSWWSVYGRFALLFSALGWLLGLAAWGAYSSPAIALALPLLWLFAPTRSAAFALTTAYHLATLRFSPAFAAPLFESLTLGIAVWLGAGLSAGLVWAVCWTNAASVLNRATRLSLALLLTLLPPAGLVIAGHPVVALGFLAPGTGWWGVIALFALIAPALAVFSVRVHARAATARGAIVAVAIMAALLWVVGDKVDADDESRGRVVGDMAAVHTQWGHFSLADDPTIDRIEKIGRAVQGLATGEDPFRTLIFPESVLGIYEPGAHAIVETQVLRRASAAGATVVLGASVLLEHGRREDIAVVYRPDGSASYIKARQAAPFAYWAPWSSDSHYPSDWFSDSSAQIAPGVKARFMFCYEEYIPFLHLLAEARDESNVVVAMANRWGTRNPLVGIVQGAHTEGMAKLFGKHWLRAENRPATPKQG